MFRTRMDGVVVMVGFHHAGQSTTGSPTTTMDLVSRSVSAAVVGISASTMVAAARRCAEVGAILGGTATRALITANLRGTHVGIHASAAIGRTTGGIAALLLTVAIPSIPTRQRGARPTGAPLSGSARGTHLSR